MWRRTDRSRRLLLSRTPGRTCQHKLEEADLNPDWIGHRLLVTMK